MRVVCASVRLVSRETTGPEMEHLAQHGAKGQPGVIAASELDVRSQRAAAQLQAEPMKRRVAGSGKSCDGKSML